MEALSLILIFSYSLPVHLSGVLHACPTEDSVWCVQAVESNTGTSQIPFVLIPANMPFMRGLIWFFCKYILQVRHLKYFFHTLSTNAGPLLYLGDCNSASAIDLVRVHTLAITDRRLLTFDAVTRLLTSEAVTRLLTSDAVSRLLTSDAVTPLLTSDAVTRFLTSDAVTRLLT